MLTGLSRNLFGFVWLIGRSFSTCAPQLLAHTSVEFQKSSRIYLQCTIMAFDGQMIYTLMIGSSSAERTGSNAGFSPEAETIMLL